MALDDSLVTAWIITLADSSRREQAERRLQAAGFEPHVFVAERPAEDEALWPGYDPRSRMAFYGFSMKRGEAGCFLSHRSLWHALSQQPDSTVWAIFEDDALPSPGLADLAQRLSQRLAGKDPAWIIKFGTHFSGWPRLSGRPIEGTLELRPMRNGGCGSHAYLLNAAAARLLVAHSRRFFHPIDDFIDRPWRHGACLYGISPEVVCIDETFESEIGNRRRAALGWREKLRRESVRSVDAIKSLPWRFGFKRGSAGGIIEAAKPAKP